MEIKDFQNTGLRPRVSLPTSWKRVAFSGCRRLCLRARRRGKEKAERKPSHLSQTALFIA